MHQGVENVGFQECHLSQMVTVLDNILMMSNTCEIRLSQALTFNLYQRNYLFSCVILIIAFFTLKKNNPE